MRGPDKLYLGYHVTWCRHQMETFSALLAICAGNSPVPGEVPAQRPVTWRFDVFFDLRLNKRLSKQSRGWWFETLSRPLWRQCNANFVWLALYMISWIMIIMVFNQRMSVCRTGLLIIYQNITCVIHNELVTLLCFILLQIHWKCFVLGCGCLYENKAELIHVMSKASRQFLNT